MRLRVAPAILLACAAIVALSGCSQDGGDERVDSLKIDYTVAASGVVHVVERIDYDFDGDRRHGIDRFLAARFSADDGNDRVYRYTNVRVESPSGASALFSTALQTFLQIRVGNSNATTGGRQSYVISYDIDGALNRTVQYDGGYLDEFYWNATGNDWAVPVEKTSVTVHGPANSVAVACFAGPPGSTQECPSPATAGSGKEAFGATSLQPGEGMTVDVGWPDGTFAATDPIIEPHLPEDTALQTTGSNEGPNPFWTPWNWGLGIALLLGIPFGFGLFVYLRRRDLEFTGETPGQIPADPATAPVGPAPRGETIVVEYQPPRGIPVGAANTILNKQRRDVDITATLVDLAVRGYLRIEEVEGGARHKAKDYRLVATMRNQAADDKAALRPHELLLLGRLFKGGRTSVTLSAIRYTFAPDMSAIKVALDAWIDNGGYFVGKVRATHPVLGWILVASIALFVGGFFIESGWLLVPAGAIFGAVAALRQGRKAIRRSAMGHAVFVQLEGFRQYIATAEADQIRFEENEDVFSRYMPWAIAFGEAERWARVFKELAESGSYTTTPDWYVGNLHAVGTGSLAGAVASISTIGAAVNGFSDLAANAMTSTATTGSSGGSGFGSSGGFSGGSSGGGGGGGGGGSW